MFMEHSTGLHKHEKSLVSGVVESVRSHSNTIETFREDHSSQAACIEQRAQDTFQNLYMVSFSAHHSQIRFRSVVPI